MPQPNDPRDPDPLGSQETPEPAPAQGSPGVAEGEDDALILWMLSLTPLQRLEAAQGFADSVVALRNGRRGCNGASCGSYLEVPESTHCEN